MQEDPFFIPIPRRKYNLRAYVPLMPVLVVLVPLLFVPAVWGVWAALHDYDAFGRSGNFVWLANVYTELTSPVFLRSVLNMLYFNVLFVPATLAVSMVLAQMLHRRPRATGLVKVALFASFFVSLTAGGIAWRTLYHPSDGIINGIIGLLGFAPVDFLNNPRLALPAVAAMNVWRWFPPCTLILMAGMRRIPSEIYDLAATDGATHWDMIRHVSTPMLRTASSICLALLLVVPLRSFEEIYVMTIDGGPSTWSTTLGFLLYRHSLETFELSSAMTLSAMLTLMIGLCAFILYGVAWRQFTAQGRQ